MLHAENAWTSGRGSASLGTGVWRKLRKTALGGEDAAQTHAAVRAAVPPASGRHRDRPAPHRIPPAEPRAAPPASPRQPSRPFKPPEADPFGVSEGLPGRLPPAHRSPGAPAGPRHRLRPRRSHLPRQGRALRAARRASPLPAGRPPRAGPVEGSAAAPLHPRQRQHHTHKHPITGGVSQIEGGQSTRPRRGYLPTPAPAPAPTHRACVKALSPGGTAASPRPEQSTPRSPSQLQEAGQGGGDAPPLGPAQLPRPQATRPSRARHRIAGPRRPPASLPRLGSARPAALRRRPARTEPPLRRLAEKMY